VTTILIDTGPLVALLNRRDKYSAWVSEVLDTIEPPVFTCDAVLSEACFLLQRVDGGADAILGLVAQGIVTSDFRVMTEVKALRTLMERFANVPMSLADACLVRMTELEADSVVVTLDRDFTIYRRNRRQAVPTISPGRQ
jgi:predicted nucleic acid-binding protein